MSYREDRDWAGRIERELGEARELLDRVHFQLALRDGRPPASKRKFWRFGAGALVLGLGAAAFALRDGRLGELLRNDEASSMRSLPTTPLGDLLISYAAKEAGMPSSERQVRWSGRVKSVSGQPFGVGAPCTLDATLRSDRHHKTTITCAGRVLHRSADAIEAPTQFATIDPIEVPGPRPGTARAFLSVRDDGPRLGPRTEATVNTADGEGHVLSAPRGEFEVRIEFEPFSEVYEGTFDRGHAQKALPFWGDRHAKLRVLRSRGPSKVAADATCEAWLHPAWSLRDERACRVLVRCGDRTLYGKRVGAFGTCGLKDGAPKSFRGERDEDNAMDVEVDWDLAAGRLDLTYFDGDTVWKVELAGPTEVVQGEVK